MREMATCLVSSGVTNSTASNVATAESLASPCISNTDTCWQQRLFGKLLLQCCQLNNQNDQAWKLREVSAALGNESGSAKNPQCEVIGVYFSFINPGSTCDEFTRQLTELYASVNGATACKQTQFNSDYQQATARDNSTAGEINIQDSNRVPSRKKKFEVVHVVLWSNVAEVLNFDESFHNHVADVPWLAVPNHDYERKVTQKMEI